MSSMRRSVAAYVFLALLFVTPYCTAQTTSAGSPSTVVAKQGGAIVTLADIDAFAEGIPKKDRPGFFDSPKRLESMITSLLLQKQLAADARKTGLDHDPSVQPQIEQALDQALSKIRIQQFKKDLKLPDFSELAQEEYVGNKEKYVLPGKLSVKHVLISTKARSEDEAKAIADTVEKEAKEHPDQFDALVEKYSEDPSKAGNKGLMTEAGSDRYMPAFSEAAKALKKPGDISPVVKTKFGFHVIKLIERTPDHQQAFADVREQIIERLRTDYVDKAMSNYTDTLRNQPIDANPDLVASLRTRYGMSPALPEAPADPSVEH